MKRRVIFEIDVYKLGGKFHQEYEDGKLTDDEYDQVARFVQGLFKKARLVEIK